MTGWLIVALTGILAAGGTFSVLVWAHRRRQERMRDRLRRAAYAESLLGAGEPRAYHQMTFTSAKPSARAVVRPPARVVPRDRDPDGIAVDTTTWVAAPPIGESHGNGHAHDVAITHDAGHVSQDYFGGGHSGGGGASSDFSSSSDSSSGGYDSGGGSGGSD